MTEADHDLSQASGREPAPQEADLRPIQEIAAKVGLTPDEIVPYGHHKAKVPLDVAKSSTVTWTAT